MNINILKPESFIQYKTKIACTIYPCVDPDSVNLFTGHKHFVVKRNETNSPLISELIEELGNNAPLRYLAHEHNLIEVNDQDVVGYLAYSQSYD
jgi:hypothetical protein